MKRWLEQSIAPLATVAMVFGLVALIGCEKKPEVYTNRTGDPAYLNDLRQVRARQNEKAAVRQRLVKQVEELVARARASLPQGATDEQVKAELVGNPQKYPGWSALSAALAKADAELRREMGNAREIVRRRISKEMADRKAVAEGRAVAKRPTATK